MANTISTGAVIVTYKTPDDQLAKCLTSLRREGVNDVVITNNDKDNRGFAAAANEGASLLASELILFLNPDAYLTTGVLLPAERLMAEKTSVGVVGLMMCAVNGEAEESSFGRTVTPWTLLIRHWQPRASIKSKREPVAVGWVSGGAMLVRREAFCKVGGFDQQFFLYWEDVDFCRRIKLAGWQVVLLPTGGVIHQRGASLADSQQKTSLYDESADKYFRKHYPKLVWLVYQKARRLYRFFSPWVS